MDAPTSVYLLLVRHGNTFNPEERARWLGLHENPPLSESGRLQLVTLASALTETSFVPQAIVTSPLERAVESGRILSTVSDLRGEMPRIDQRLNELDYGVWANKHDDEIIALYGRAALDGWRNDGVRPIEAGFAPAEDVLLDECTSFLNELTHGQAKRVLAVSSNGRIRYIARAVRGEQGLPDGVTGTLGTGRAALLKLTSKEQSILFWNEAPQDVKDKLEAAGFKRP